MSSLVNSFIQYNDQHQMAICSHSCCQIAISKNTLKWHLSKRPHHLKQHQWKPMLDALKDKPLPAFNADFPRPSNGGQPVPYLKVMDGFECNICGWVRVSQKTMRFTHGKIHKDDPEWEGGCFFHPVKVQVSSQI